MEIKTLGDFLSFFTKNKKIKLTRKDRENVKKTRSVLEDLVTKQKIYGVNTGVGALLDVEITEENFEKFQRCLILEHACGVGDIAKKEITKGALLLLINCLKKGYSGVSLETLDFLVNLFNKDRIPTAPEIGSLGASGDLIPLAHMMLPFVGKGSFWVDSGLYGSQVISKISPTKDVITAPKLKMGEAIFLINGTHFTTSMFAFVVSGAMDIYFVSDVVTAFTAEALGYNFDAFSGKVNDLKKHSGQHISALNLGCYLSDKQNSEIKSLQDGYSIRCAPQVHGSIIDIVEITKKTLEAEFQSISHNPAVFTDSHTIVSGGNFHAQPIAVTADSLGVSLATIASISERRVERILNTHTSHLPPFLSDCPGLSSGLMMLQYAAASLVSRNGVLIHPASVGSISVSGSQEDFVSMATTAVWKAGEILENSWKVLAIEAMCAVKAISIQRVKPCLENEFLREVFEKICDKTSFLKEADDLSGDIKTVTKILKEVWSEAC
ncbi:MAG: aromatic amino acid ammonia-lyase [Candidatus Marinimicrobia bacterium]|nr:aromatic amino acid ammonia-lyase [Candidatus Neomarinimicrobiota bacterium]